ncbi:streptococcal hemagglutinin [Antennarius striatus]|uniref:streptococcal hemagglutinin n=1 Tax=Antennarius striatus TaxID=241820 RepID=UPI0035B40066
MEISERVVASLQIPADVSQSVGQASFNQRGAQSGNSAGQDQRHPELGTDGWEVSQLSERSLQPEFQDSNLSPALPLMPVNAGVEQTFTEYSLFQQSDNEFAPLRAYPDMSMASVKFHFPPQESTNRVSEPGSLSLHPLTQNTILSEGEGSCGSLSQHSFSPEDDDKDKETFRSPLIPTADGQEVQFTDDTDYRKKDSEAVKDTPDKQVREAADDEMFFLRKEVPVQHLLDLLQRDIGMLTGSSSLVSSTSETSVKNAASFPKNSESTQVGKPGIDRICREGPPGEASLPWCQTQQADRDLSSDQSQTLSEVCNVTVGIRSTLPDESSDVLHRELLSEAERRRWCKSESGNLQSESPPPGQPPAPHPPDVSGGPTSVTRTKSVGVPQKRSFSAGLPRGHREDDLWFTGHQTGIDSSYLGILPQSQSTPGFFKPHSKSSVKAKVGQLSPIESQKENFCQSNSGISPQPATPVEADVQQSVTSNQFHKEAATSDKVQSLPSLSYLQKVDAWRANQTSGKMSLFDSLALHGFSGISPKKKAYDAVSDSLDHILSQRLRSLQQPPVLSPSHQDVTQSSSSAPSCSSNSRRGEAVGSAPSDGDNAASAPKPSASPVGRSQSLSSLSTVVMSGDRDQQVATEEERSRTQGEAPQAPGASAPLFTLASLGRFSDVSLSSSQDSRHSGMKLGASIGASSVVSLEVDTYTPQWTSKPSTTPPLSRTQELNIEERIPLYLHNLGIDQSPSTILNPFAPRGPIREPEFSPTDLCTIRASTATPTKSTQPSEDDSPNKGDFSRSSVLSAASSVSVPFSVDSLAPTTSIPEWTRQKRPPFHVEVTQRDGGLNAASSLLDEDSGPSTLQNAVPQQRDSGSASSLNTCHSGDRLDSEFSLTVEARDVESPLQTSRSVEETPETSLISPKALSEIHSLPSQVEGVVSTGSSAIPSGSPAAPRPLPDNETFFSMRKKTSGLQHSSSSATGDARTQQSLPWAGSSSHRLTSERQRGSSIGQEMRTSSGQLPSTQPPTTDEPTDAHRRAAGSSFVLSQSARRAEPEGCSAAPPDNTAAPQPPAVRPPPAVSTQQLTPPPTDTTDVTVEKKIPEDPAQSSSSSPVPVDTDQGAVSDGSSGSSLAVRVAKLLQSESPATVASSSASATDHEESKSRDWMKMKIPGQQWEPPKLDKEDRRRIEEIKRELLLKNPIKSPVSTETESSAASSVGVQRGPDPAQQAELPFALSDAKDRSSSAVQRLGSDPSHPGIQLQNHPRPDLEAQIREIAAREGVTLPRTNPRSLTSITITTRMRSTSPSTSPAPSTSPEPEMVHLSDFSTGAVQVCRNLLPITDDSSRKSNLPLQRQETVGGQFEEPPPQSVPLVTENVNADDDTQTSVSVGLEAEDATAPARMDHVSRVRLTPPPKSTPRSSAVHARHQEATKAPPQKEFVPLRRSSPAATSPDEGVGSSSPAEWCDNGGPTRRRGTGRADTSTRFRTPQGNMTSTSLPHHSVVVLPRPLNSSPALPVLLPYKPRGSEELFYVPQTEADLSSTEPSDTTSMESTHSGSDDAVPPAFSSDVLGHADPGLDRGVTIRHTEGIYSKRAKTAASRMNQSEQRASGVTPAPKTSQVSANFTEAPLSTPQGASKGAPMQFLRPTSQPVQMETDRDEESRSSLDRLWRRFCTQWTLEESRPTSDREGSLLERLERLSRLIHGARGVNTPEAEEKLGKRGHTGEVRKSEDTEPARRGGGGRTVDGKPPIAQRRQEDDSFTSNTSPDSSQSPLLCPADRDDSETSSFLSGSTSTVDTVRLIRVFGAHRVQRLKTSSSLSKLYQTIDRQKDGREQRRGRKRETHHFLSETNESTVGGGSASSTSLSTPTSHRGPSRALEGKKPVKLVHKSIQAGDLDLVCSGTRPRTRDVGTTFPSPGTPRPNQSSSSCSERGGGGQRSPSKTDGPQKKRRSRKSPTKAYPEGVSWFISADELRSDARKENWPEEEEWKWNPSTAWFEPYIRTKAWRKPLRQRQVSEDGKEPLRFTHQAETESKLAPSGGTRVSLQEALETRRPEFISQSRRRLERLALLAEERKLQEVFSRENEERFSRPRGPKPAGTALLRRAVPRKEMIQRSKQIYENLPEVQRRKQEERRKAEYRSYRLNAQLYNKRITNRVLGRRTAWN